MTAIRHGPVAIVAARTAEDIAATAGLFRAYVEWLGVDLSFQNFDDELARMPGKYAPPRGEILLARDAAGAPVGCVALRPMEFEGACEMKRLYVVPAARGSGLGCVLVEAILAEARRIGYSEMRLDTIPALADAIALYRKFGFVDIEPYYDTPIPGTIFLGCNLGNRPVTR